MTAKTKEQEKAYVLSGIVALATLSILAAVLLFDHSFEKQESHCNDAVCADVIAIASVSFGIISVGNPIGVGVVCVSSFVAIGLVPIAPVAIGVLPIGIVSLLGYQYLALGEETWKKVQN